MMLWIPIVIIVIAYLVWSELGSNECTLKCNNTIPKVSDQDTNKHVIDKTIDLLRVNSTSVNWRRAALVAIISSIAILLYLFDGVPNGFIVSIVSIIVFIFTYFSDSWFQSHWWRMNNDAIEDSLTILRNRIK